MSSFRHLPFWICFWVGMGAWLGCAQGLHECAGCAIVKHAASCTDTAHRAHF